MRALVARSWELISGATADTLPIDLHLDTIIAASYRRETMSSATYSLTFNSKLTEDYIHKESILGSGSARSPMATFVNAQGQSEALLINDDGELCHLQREPLSSSGWNIYGIGAIVQSIAAVNSGSVWITDIGEGIWQSNAGH
jgi:hypothetical protein